MISSEYITPDQFHIRNYFKNAQDYTVISSVVRTDVIPYLLKVKGPNSLHLETDRRGCINKIVFDVPLNPQEIDFLWEWAENFLNRLGSAGNYYNPTAHVDLNRNPFSLVGILGLSFVFLFVNSLFWDIGSQDEFSTTDDFESDFVSTGGEFLLMLVIICAITGVIYLLYRMNRYRLIQIFKIIYILAMASYFFFFAYMSYYFLVYLLSWLLWGEYNEIYDTVFSITLGVALVILMIPQLKCYYRNEYTKREMNVLNFIFIPPLCLLGFFSESPTLSFIYFLGYIIFYNKRNVRFDAYDNLVVPSDEIVAVCFFLGVIAGGSIGLYSLGLSYLLMMFGFLFALWLNKYRRKNTKIIYISIIMGFLGYILGTIFDYLLIIGDLPNV